MSYNCSACGETHNSMADLQACHASKKQASSIDTMIDAMANENKKPEETKVVEEPVAAAKYRKLPVVIDAFRIGIDSIPEWFMDKVTEGSIVLKTDAPPNVHIDQRKEYKTWCEIETLEGVMTGDYGDWIIKGVNGELYPCKPDIFAKTYEAAEDKVVAPIPDLPAAVRNEKGKMVLPLEYLPDEVKYMSQGQYMGFKILGVLRKDGLVLEEVEVFR